VMPALTMRFGVVKILFLWALSCETTRFLIKASMGLVVSNLVFLGSGVCAELTLSATRLPNRPSSPRWLCNDSAGTLTRYGPY